MIKSWEDLFRAVSKDCRMDETLPDFTKEDIEFFHKELWKSIRYYLERPLECKRGILVNYLFRFKFKQNTINRYIKDEKNKIRNEERYETYFEIKQMLDGKE